MCAFRGILFFNPPARRSDDGNVRLAAVRADRAVVDGCAAVRATLLQHLAAHRAELAADGIGRVAIRQDERPPFHLVGAIGRAMRIGAKPDDWRT